MRKKGMRIATMLAAIAALALVVPASAAPAVKSKLKITQISSTGASGTLSSKEAKCEKRRKVALWFEAEYSPVRVGSTKTNKKGRWKINTALQDTGFYYATAKKVKRGAVKCARGDSKSVRYTG